MKDMTETEVKYQVSKLLHAFYFFWNAISEDGLLPTHNVLCRWKHLATVVSQFIVIIDWAELFERWNKK